MTTSRDALALNGGAKAVRARPPHFRWPPVDERTHRAVAAQLDDSISIYGRSGVIQRVEERLRTAAGVEFALLTSSGTSSLHSAYVGCNLGPDYEVVCPVYTFFATVMPLLFTGAVPIFADCDPDGNLSPAAAAAAMTERTKAIVVTHMWGVPAAVEELRELANEHGALLVEDASHAFGATCGGRPVGSFGDVAAQSLQGQKPLTGGEGGVLLTDDADILYRALALGHYNRRCKDEIPRDHWLAEYAVTGMGLKLRIHPLAAAIVEQQLDVFDEILERRNKFADRMRVELERLPGVTVVQPRPGATASWYALMLRLDLSAFPGTGIDDVHDALLAEGALEVDRPGSTRPLAQLPLFQTPGAVFPRYRGVRMAPPDAFPEACAFHESVLKLPVWHADEDAEIVEQYLEAFQKVWDTLERRGVLRDG